MTCILALPGSVLHQQRRITAKLKLAKTKSRAERMSAGSRPDRITRSLKEPLIRNQSQNQKSKIKLENPQPLNASHCILITESTLNHLQKLNGGGGELDSKVDTTRDGLTQSYMHLEV